MKIVSAREEILKSIAQNRPSFKEVSEINITGGADDSGDLIKLFISALENNSGKVIQVDAIESIKSELCKDLQGANYVVNTIHEIGLTNPEITSSTSAGKLNHVYKAYIKGKLGISENGSIWIDENVMVNRLLPFISEHLVILIYDNEIVLNMHDAYKKIDIAKTGFGVFVAGPSKTADIEQWLVVGAHGPRSLTVYLIKDKN